MQILRIYLINPIEANSELKSKKGDKEFIPELYQNRLVFTCDKMNCLFESIDFNVNIDGSIEF